MFQNLDFWMIELFIICYLNSLVFKTQIYNHQIVAILFSLFSSLLKVCTIILSFLDTSIPKGDYSPIYYLKSNPALRIIFIIIFYLLVIFLRSIVYLSLKGYMDLKYISPCQILLSYGIFGTILYLTFCIITTKFNCEPKSFIYYYMCNVNYNENRYIDSFYNYFSNYKSGFKEIIIEIIVIILGIPLFFFNKYFSTLVIKYLSPVHVIFSIPIIFLLEKIVMITNTLIIRYFSEKKEEINIMLFFQLMKRIR
jgi:hypothetical protein